MLWCVIWPRGTGSMHFARARQRRGARLKGEANRLSETFPTETRSPSAGIDLQGFVLEENVKLYRRLLAETDDEERRQVLDGLLAEAAAALRGHIGSHSKSGLNACEAGPADRLRRLSDRFSYFEARPSLRAGGPAGLLQAEARAVPA